MKVFLCCAGEAGRVRVENIQSSIGMQVGRYSSVLWQSGAMTLVLEKGIIVLTEVQRLWGFVSPSVDGGNEARGGVVLPEACGFYRNADKG